ncbi:MAG: GNAT family N-acetyltransferase [Candidatus Lokiarchaeota archaeon]|nr:GNAT family N-acetyltransferase [Candidatus Lokiarchaeota archaeon]
MHDPLSEYLIERFDLKSEDHKLYCDVVKTAFLHHKHSQGGTILFDEETFNIMFGSPYQDKDLFIRAIHKETGDLVGFVGAIPRHLVYQGKEYKFGVPAWISVHYKHQKKGLARAMGIKLLEYGANTARYEGGFVEFDSEDHGLEAFDAVFRGYDYEINDILSMDKFVVRAFDVKKLSSVIKLQKIEKFGLRLLQKVQKVNNPLIRKSKPEDHERLYELLQDHIERNELSVIRDKEDFLWYLQQPGVNCVVHEDESGAVDGFIIAWKFQLAGFGNAINFGWLDCVHIHRLSSKDASDLCKYLCVVSKELGWEGLQTPYIPYFDPKPFKKAKFIFYPKKLIISSFKFRPTPIPKNVKSFYFDWR